MVQIDIKIKYTPAGATVHLNSWAYLDILVSRNLDEEKNMRYFFFIVIFFKLFNDALNTFYFTVTWRQTFG